MNTFARVRIAAKPGILCVNGATAMHDGSMLADTVRLSVK